VYHYYDPLLTEPTILYYPPKSRLKTNVIEHYAGSQLTAILFSRNIKTANPQRSLKQSTTTTTIQSTRRKTTVILITSSVRQLQPGTEVGCCEDLETNADSMTLRNTRLALATSFSQEYDGDPVL